MSWRDNLHQGRRDVQQEMHLPAVYVKPDGTAAVRVDVREHTRFATVQPQNVGSGMPSLMDTTPRLVFDRAEVPHPRRNHMVAMGPTEVYRLGASRPPNADFITVTVSQLPEAEAAEFWQAEWADLLT